MKLKRAAKKTLGEQKSGPINQHKRMAMGEKITGQTESKKAKRK